MRESNEARGDFAMSNDRAKRPGQGHGTCAENLPEDMAETATRRIPDL